MEDRSLDRKENIKKKNDTNNERPDSDTRHSLAILTFKAHWLLYVPPSGTVVLPHCVFTRSARISAVICLHSINCLVFITEMGSVY